MFSPVWAVDTDPGGRKIVSVLQGNDEVEISGRATSISDLLDLVLEDGADISESALQKLNASVGREVGSDSALNDVAFARVVECTDFALHVVDFETFCDEFRRVRILRKLNDPRTVLLQQHGAKESRILIHESDNDLLALDISGDRDGYTVRPGDDGWGRCGEV